jgi:hypothetical protein
LLIVNIFNGRSGWRRTAVTTGVVAAVLVGSMQAPVWAADNPPVSLTDTQWANILINSGMRIKDAGVDLDKDTVASAELLDWRTRNPSADNRTMLIHLGTLRSALNGQLTAEQARQPHAEVLRRMLGIVYGTPGAAITGSHLTQLLAAVTGRDLAQAMPTEEQRLTGGQQDLDVDVKYSQFQAQVWADTRAQSTVDTTFATMWRQQIGTAAGAQPVSIDPTASVDTLKVMPILKDMINVDALKAQGALGQTQFVAEVLRQEAPLQTKLIDTSNLLNDKLKQTAASTPAPGSPVTAPTPGMADEFKKQVDDWQKTIDQVKSGLDFGVQTLKDIAPTAGSQLLTFVDVLYKLGTQANKLIGALETLGAATSIGAAFGGVGAVVGAAVGIVQVLGSLLGGGGADKAAQQQILDAITSGFQAVQKNLQAIYTTMNARFDRIDASLNQIYAKMQEQFQALFTAILAVNANVIQVHSQLLTLQTELESFGVEVLDSMRDMTKDPFIQEIGHYLDYPLFNNGKSIPTLDQYIEAVSNYYTTGTTLSRQAPFVASAKDSGTAHDVLGKYGTAGSIDWLANFANNYLGTNFGVPAAASATPNMDLWAEAARAYYLTALQNPDYAVSNEGTAQVRAHSLADTGTAVNAMLAQFNAPDPNASDKVNALFKNLNTAYQNDLKAFAAQAYQKLRTKVMSQDPKREFNLWYNYDGRNMDVGALTVDQRNALPGPPPSSPQCGNGGSGQIPTPAVVDGHDVGYLQYGRWIDPSWTITSCYTNPGWSGTTTRRCAGRPPTARTPTASACTRSSRNGSVAWPVARTRTTPTRSPGASRPATGAARRTRRRRRPARPRPSRRTCPRRSATARFPGTGTATATTACPRRPATPSAS